MGASGTQEIDNLEPVTLAILIAAASVLAGCFGSLTGLGGGIVLIPILVLGFKVDLAYAVAASLVAVVATSSGAAASYVREGYVNVRIAMVLEVATVVGGIGGALVAHMLPRSLIGLLFGAVALWSALGAIRPPRPAEPGTAPDRLSVLLRLGGTYPTPQGPAAYQAHRVAPAFGVMLGAGVLSALLGIGSGVLKVLAMDRLMKLPFRVSTTTSNLMIGVTAASGSGVYLAKGQIEPLLCGPVALGALTGSMIGARLLPKVRSKWLRIIFAVAVAATGCRMIYEGASGGLDARPAPAEVRP